jgi:phospholipid/cholesterol/gamma-HCH transport system substrate-binding protein
MPRTRSLAWSELKLGVLTMVAIIVAAATIFSVMGSRGFFWQRYALKTRFSNIQGLKAGSPVRVAGVEVGSVTDTLFAGDQVDVIRVEQDASARDDDSRPSSVRSHLGLSSVDITASSTGTPIRRTHSPPVRRRPRSDVTTNAQEALSELTGLIKDTPAGTAGKFAIDDQL